MRMRSPLLITAACVLLGVIISIAIGWSAQIRSWPAGAGGMVLPMQSDSEWWRRNAPAGVHVPEHPTNMNVAKDWGRTHRLMVANTVFGGSVIGEWQQCGWPMRCLEGQAWQDTGRQLSRDLYLIRVPSQLPRAGVGLPLRPIWWGFLINTLFFAMIFWIPMVGMPWLRRYRRRQRGLCESCGYPRGDRDRCTECGEPLRGRNLVVTACVAPALA